MGLATGCRLDDGTGHPLRPDTPCVVFCRYVGRCFVVVAIELGERPRLLSDNTEPAGAVGVELAASTVVAGPEFVMDARRNVYLVVGGLVLTVVNNAELWTTGLKKLLCRLLGVGSTARPRLPTQPPSDPRRSANTLYGRRPRQKRQIMPRPEVLERVKQAEADADEIVAEAESDRDERVQAAREEADEILAEAEAEADELEEDRLAAAREEIDAERERIVEEGEQERQALIDRARDRTDEAVEHAVEKFEEAVHAQT